MGVVSFLIPESLTPAARECLSAACLAGGYDLAPIPTQYKIDGNQFTLTKDSHDSGYLMMPWPLQANEVSICTSSTLRERAEPYYLLIELARGKLNQIRSQTAEWEAIGLGLELDDLRELLEVTKRFGQAVLDATNPQSSVIAEEVLVRTHALTERISATFAEQLLLTRLADAGPLETRLGCRLTTLPLPATQAQFSAIFTSVKLVPNWSLIESTESQYDWAAFDTLVDWAIQCGLDVTIGPVIDLANGVFPTWIQQWVGDPPSLAAFMCDYIETLVRRYQNRVRSWQICGGFNYIDCFGLTEDDRIRLAARLLEAARHTDPDISFILSIAQPWGDYLKSEDYTYTPLVFADTLIRAGFSFTAVELEILTGADRRASPSRDSIAIYRLLELFGLLTIPLELNFGANIQSAASQLVDGQGALRSAIESQILLAAALPQVRAVFWEGWSEADSRIPGANLSGGTSVRQSLRTHLHNLRVRYLA